ncbi:exosome complex component RRP4 homolog [Mercurialis annua]|uniref:exosome complex component RRP4 homolog n=1 Tax=Mercurialis annua TaxID=3986 RepID=UPI002160252D|nr:exosome complex component RRP4 homolog [Mercurialis annua]
MREIKLSLTPSQKIRLQRALQQLESFYSNKSYSDASVTVADTIPISLEDGNILKGHGTSERDGEVVATICGVVERVNMLVYVRSLRARYKPEIGDIIVGRVIEVAQKRWKLEINYNQDAVLMLSSMNLPDGIQRRRTALDELNMRNVFEEKDVVCAEVRNFQHDGGLQLQARSQKYGKLEKGQLLTVSPYLVKRQKQHFHYLEQYNVDLIVGCNGFIWVGEHVDIRDIMIEDQVNNTEHQNIESSKASEDVPIETRRNICCIANAVRVLSTLGFCLTLDVILETINLSSAKNIGIDEMLGSEFHVLVAEKEAERRSSSVKKKR